MAIEIPPDDPPVDGLHAHPSGGEPDAAAPGHRRVNLISRSPTRHCTFRIGQRSGVWFVTRDGVFYGDYLSQAQATEAACFGARTVEAQGSSARVLAGSGEVVVPHQDARRKL